MPNKRPPRNAYVFFVMEMMPELRRRGLPVKGLRDAVPHCSEEWALLSPEEKEKYAEMARLWKNSDPEPSTSKNSHPDQVFGQRKVQGKAALVPTLTEKAVVQLDASSKRNQGSAESVFYFLHILSHGELPSHCDQRFLPCEIACVRYSLHDGLMGSFHHFIDPGEIPRGFRFQCQAASTATHQIPISGFELTNSDYHNLFRELCGFVCPAPGTWPPVYCKSDDLYRIKWCLKWLADKAGMENKFKLLNVEDLIVKLYKDKLQEEPSRTRVCSLFEVSEWDYARNTRCKWHEEKDILFCSLASCKKITYCISRALAPVYGINLTPAHLPTREKDVQNSGNPKIVVLDAKRFQNRMDSRYFHDNPLNSGAADVNGNHALEPRGLTPYKPSLGRGRGIVRLLESLSFAEK